MKRIAAIDIGSNAVRMLICYVISSGENNIFQKNSYLRLPIRLGEDSFKDGLISNSKIHKLSNAILSFKYIMNVHEVEDYQIYATSALRESKNYKQVILEIKKTTGLKINLISGLKEAKIISKGNSLEKIEFNRTFLYVDVGGGSTEFSILRKGIKKKSKSFKIGTVRLLNNSVDERMFIDIKSWLDSCLDDQDKIKLFATGGNINKIQSMTGSKIGKPISYLSLKDLYNTLTKYNYHERMVRFDLNPDRADVIIPSLKIFISTMESVGSNKIFVPKVGLVDGMINEIFYEKNGIKLNS
ncbi:exopolyphosphatase [Flavobacteriaceae bacterium]|nr:exopolyphosphatase [Flavobacteriaceae bacterium]MDA9850710.1 exopolyphosphatase [Flavobacteriaceae bacterium]MDB3874503.1 exopolyphosphatase [Flavobacteriaceae bacterium]